MEENDLYCELCQERIPLVNIVNIWHIVVTEQILILHYF